MIYIISEKTDLMTDLVIEYLVARNAKFKRYNDDTFCPSSFYLSNEGQSLSPFINAGKIWNRRGRLNLLPDAVNANYESRRAFVNYLKRETETLNFYQEDHLKRQLKKNYLGSFAQEMHTNKLINLSFAKEIGFRIPETLVTTEKKELIAFNEKHPKVITKDLKAPANIRAERYNLTSTGVKLVNQKMIDQLEETFVPIFLQQYTEKKYEIRVFIACEKLYPMAIFSQSDRQTQVDYRNYNKRKPNRCVPVHLPESIQEKIWTFMRTTAMDTASMDIILTPENEYCFLEVNPMGQFHWLSENCNYHIEKDIAEFLCDEKN